MSRVNERAVADDPNGEWLAALPHLSAVARECFPPAVRDGLPAVRRLRGLLVEREDAHRLHPLSKRIVDLAPVIDRRRARIDADGVFRVDVRFTLALPDGDGSRALTVVDGPDGWLLDPELTAGLEDLDPFPVGDPLLGAQGALFLEDAERQVWWYPPAQLTPALEPIADGRYQVVLSGELSVDPATAAAGGPLPPGTYTVWFIGSILGVGRRRRLVMPRAARRTPPVWTPSRGKVAVRPDWSTPGAKLRLEIAEQRDEPIEPPAPAAVPGRSSRAGRFLDRIRRGGDLTAYISDRYIFSRGACFSDRRFRPDEPKSTSAIDLSPSPEVATTLPMPNVECSTRSPATSDGICRTFGGAAP